VDTRRFHPRAASRSMRDRLAGGADPKDVRALAIYVGRVSPEKNLDLMLDLHDAVPGLHLAVVGDGPDRGRLERKASSRRIHFTGFLRGDELSAAYASADVFFMPSTTETLGFVVLEAMSAGTPAVAAAAGGVRDLVNPGENGLLFDPDDVSQAIAHVRQLIDHPSQRRHLARQARKFAESASWQGESRRLVGEYQLAIHRARRTDWLTRLRDRL
jgi:glycosyltransferase involved in cell wall biosynthesis